jgi:hypothetical protein
VRTLNLVFDMAPVAYATGSHVDFDVFLEADECVDDVVAVRTFRAGGGFVSARIAYGCKDRRHKMKLTSCDSREVEH